MMKTTLHLKPYLRASLAGAVLTLGVVCTGWAQPLPAASPSPRSKELPPLNLPAIPAGTMDDDDAPAEDSTPAMPQELPPATLPVAPPVPEGTPEVNSKLSAHQKNAFRIEYDGKLVGFSMFEVSGRAAVAGESSWIINSISRLKLGVGSKDDSKFEAKLMVDTKTLAPTYFHAEQTTGGGNFGVDCLYSKTVVVQKNTAGKQAQQYYHNYEDQVPKLLFNNLWGHLDTFPEHYWLLVRSAIKGGRLPAYDPILRGGGDLLVYAPTAEKWKYNGQSLNTMVYPVSDMAGTMLARVRLETKTLDLLEVDEVGSGITLRRTGPQVMAEVEKIKSTDLLPRRVAASNVIFPEPEKLTALEADVDLSLRGGELVAHEIPGYKQSFSGEVTEGHMKGHVVVRSTATDIPRKTKYPLKGADAPPADVAEYLKTGPGVESDWPPLMNKALELTWKSDSTYTAARKLMNFCTGVEEGVSLPSARYAFEAQVGNPESKALLLVALARGAGLPARTIGGLLYREGQFVPHHWAEIWLGPAEGWAPWDPTTAEAGRLGAAHIALWSSGDIQSMAVKVLNYAPHAPRRVAFFNRELAWSVGEERVYEILQKGKRIGEETAAVRDIVVSGDEDLYRFEAATKIEGGTTTIDSTSELMVDPNGLPVQFSLKGVKGKLDEQNFTFKKDTARLESETASGKKSEKEIPFSYGTYFTDSRFLSQWALVLGQALDANPEKQPKVGDKISFFTFVPDTMKSQEIVLEMRENETLKVSPEEEIEVKRLEAETGMAFLLNDKNQVVKIEVPEQNLELQLKATKFTTK